MQCKLLKGIGMKSVLVVVLTVVTLGSGMAKAKHRIGEHFGGGTVFYVDSAGEHGLIAADSDQGMRIRWNSGANMLTNATGDGVGAGAANTKLIIGLHGPGIYAAALCSAYHGGGFTDWYLPSKAELNLLYMKKNLFGGFLDCYYWSSTEYVSYDAWNQSFGQGDQFGGSKEYPGGIRAVRAF